MRKSAGKVAKKTIVGPKPAAGMATPSALTPPQRPLGSTLANSINANTNKANTTLPSVNKIEGFGDGDDDADGDTKNAGKSIVGVVLSIQGEQGDTIVSQEEVNAKKPLVIPVKRNANWMEKARKTRTASSGSSTQKQGDALENSNVREEKTADNEDSPDQPASTSKSTSASLRQEAIDALLHGDDKPKKGDLVIPLPSKDNNDDNDNSGSDYYSDDVDDAAYERVPVEDFGAAMLRGMGWKGDDDKNSKDAAEFKPRPSLLGLGAKPRPEDTTPANNNRPKRY
ncbi:DNA primase large subunit Spp2 [Coemansia sp. Benny D115]|nr:DNA primase large subunit Spp2 [Coemansia sp. Benny D115]